jgi:release factor glutamine methyltransferase
MSAIAELTKLHTARISKLDVELIIGHMLELPREWVLAHPERKFTKLQKQLLNLLVCKRADGLPLSYITGYKEFYGKRFIVNEFVLIPRPETEDMVERAIEILGNNPDYIMLDMGTGSGCIGMSVALALDSENIICSDVSGPALEVARLNKKKLHPNVPVVRSDMFEHIEDDIDLLCANLPYVPKSLKNKPDIQAEPAIALFSDNKGLAHYQQMFEAIKKRAQKPSIILVESLVEQQPKLETLAAQFGYKKSWQKALITEFTKN